MNKVSVIGAGGHAKVVISTLLACGYAVEAVYDDNTALWNTSIWDIPIIGGIHLLEGKNANAVIAIGDNKIRQEIASRLPKIKWITAIHPFSMVHSSASIKEGSIVFAGTVIQPDVTIGKHVIVNTSASIDHDCNIGDFVHIAPGCHLAGNVQVKRGSFLGVGTTVIPNITINEWATVGAGSNVITSLGRNNIYYGNPARKNQINRKTGLTQ